MDNNSIQDPSTPPPQPPIEPTKTNNSKVLLISFVVLEIITLLIAGYFGYQYYQLKRLFTQSRPPTTSELSSINMTTPNPTLSPSTATLNWQTYSNAASGFSIKYPTSWRTQESPNWVGFGPKEMGEDVVLGVSYYNKSEKTVAQIKDGAGKQFSDRKQTEEIITFGGLTATKLITTTSQLADWYSVTIIIDSGNMLYAISNGAQTDEALNDMLTKKTGATYNIRFEDFYTTFKFTK